ncbi:leucine--tRNA ligase [Halomicrobium mukohataei]|uniref:Leucine--tRNA ligase n=1 Tax=Halomicrobium mukohataei TaxID=57705 RepID=A0A847UC24_9EURY|nr:leucine--tRNA ligase [Halomicrobium mukohataei]NLV09010.1 leucine--tRNA ligase [Halomicrobium mukohataei]
MSDSSSGYDPSAIEPKWQAEWDDAEVFRTPDSAEDVEYVLAMFPYTSGNLHMGHVRNYTITDAYSRYRRMQGEDVLHPMGWDSFGLPAENAAEERDTSPEEWTRKCIESMKAQMSEMGFGYDWDREVTTCDPEYYRWNQWLFKRFHEAGLVERKGSEVNWCPSCETVLADEQVEGEAELCWRCDTPVTQRDLDQWFLTITDYADELVDDIDELSGWPESVRAMQRDWIGRQHGARVPFEVSGYGEVEIFTTRLDTIHGATFFAVAPDSEIAQDLADSDEEVAHFVEEEADPDGDEPNGVATDLTATNPATGEEIPVFVADFVLSDVGTGALMAVPAHDERDHAFASKKDVPIEPVVKPADGDVPDVEDAAYTEDGVLVNSGDYDGYTSADARSALEEDLPGARHDKQYRLRDWGISRQRYWGTPIPMVHCEDCGAVPVPDEDLPVELPEFVQTTGNPLDEVDEFVQTTCPDCGGPAQRETDTMDTFVDSSWYFLRYTAPDRDDGPFDTARANDWMPVDQYVGGIEHAVMHLLYARFVTKAISDLELLDHREPFQNLVTQGMVQLDGEKMSKSKGNVVSPQNIVEEYGADTARLFMMQAARPERDFDWKDEGVASSHRFLTRLYDAVEAYVESPPAGEAGDVTDYVRREIDRVTAIADESYANLTFTEALRETRELLSLLDRYAEATEPHAETVEAALSTIVRLLAPVAPHVTEELWAKLTDADEGFVAEADWPTADGDLDRHQLERQLVEDTREDVRQIVDVADIEDPNHVEIAVAPEWKFEAHAIAREFDGDNLVGEIMSDERFRGEDGAPDYAKDLQAELQTLTETLDAATEAEVLARARWLIAEEFDAEVTVRAGEDADPELVRKAEPGRPAINIE